MGEPYEKPAVQVVDLGNLIDLAERSASEAQAAFEQARSRLDALQYEPLQIEGDLAEAAGMLGMAKQGLQKATTIKGMVDEQEPSGS